MLGQRISFNKKKIKTKVILINENNCLFYSNPGLKYTGEAKINEEGKLFC